MMQQTISGQWICSILICIFLAEGANSQVRASDMPPTLTVGDVQLVLNGAGFRETWWTKVYEAALYLPQRTADLAFIRDPATPKAIRIRVTYAEGTKDQDVPDSWYEEIRPEVSAEQMDQLEAAYARLQHNDTILIAYRPQGGSTVWKNEQEILTEPGHGLVEGLLNLWLGSEPVSDNLKRALLGGRDAK